MGSTMGNMVVARLEPGLLLVCAVLVAELRFEHLGFFAAAKDLQGKDDRKDSQQPGKPDEDSETDNEQRAENVNRVADAGVESAGHECRRPGTDAERPAQLKASDHQQKKCRRRNGEAHDSMWRPRKTRCLPEENHHEYCNHHERNDIEFQSYPPADAEA